MASPIRTAHVLYSGLGGHGNVVFNICNALTPEERAATQLCFYGIEPLAPGYADECERLQIPCDCIQKSPGLDPESMGKVVAALARQRPQVVFVHSVILAPVLAFACGAWGGKMAVVEHQTNALKSRREWVCSWLSLMLSPAVVYLTEDYAREMKQRVSPWAQRADIHVINNGIDVSAYQQSAAASERKRLRIGMHGRFVPGKDVPTLLQAVERLSQGAKVACELELVGDGPLRNEWEAACQKLSVDVTFRGRIPAQGVPAFLSGLDIYVQSTLGETMSTAVMEAMAAGLPVVASDVPGVSNMLRQDLTGLLVPAQDPQALTDALARLAKDEGLRRSLGKRAHAHAKAVFDRQQTARRYVELARLLVSPSRG